MLDESLLRVYEVSGRVNYHRGIRVDRPYIGEGENNSGRGPTVGRLEKHFPKLPVLKLRMDMLTVCFCNDSDAVLRSTQRIRAVESMLKQ